MSENRWYADIPYAILATWTRMFAIEPFKRVTLDSTGCFSSP
jgi:hypothetical protein